MDMHLAFLLLSFHCLISHAAATLSSTFTETPDNNTGSIKAEEGSNVTMKWAYNEASGEAVEKISFVTLSPSSPAVADITILTVAPGSPPVVLNDLDGRVKYNGGASFTLTNVGRNDSLWYGCFLYFGFGDFLRDNFKLEVQVGPNAVGSGSKERAVKEGVTTSESCSATGTPTPNVIWSCNGAEVTRGAGSATLNITMTRTDPNKTCECHAKNDVKRILVKTVLFYIDYKEIPKITTFLPGNWTGEEGSELNISCDASGFPLPMVTLTSAESSVPLSSPYNLIVNSSHNGKVFQCKAENSEGKDMASIALNVLYKPYNTDIKLSGKQISCTSVGNPAVSEYTLYFNSTIFSTKAQCAWDISQSGFYHVISKNMYGMDISKVIVFNCCDDPTVAPSEDSDGETGMYSKELIIALIVACAVLLVLVIIVLIVYCKMRKKYAGGGNSFRVTYGEEPVTNGSATRTRSVGNLNQGYEKESTTTTLVGNEMTEMPTTDSKPAVIDSKPATQNTTSKPESGGQAADTKPGPGASRL